MRSGAAAAEKLYFPRVCQMGTRSGRASRCIYESRFFRTRHLFLFIERKAYQRVVFGRWAHVEAEFVFLRVHADGIRPFYFAKTRDFCAFEDDGEAEHFAAG